MSPLRHHISSLYFEDKRCDVATVQLLTHLPSLTQLSLTVNGDAFMHAAGLAGGGAGAAAFIGCMFPSSVTNLDLTLGDCEQLSQAQRLLLNVVSSHPQLTSLKLNFTLIAAGSEVNRELSVLQRLPLLTTLELSGIKATEISAKALASLASLKSLWLKPGQLWTPELVSVLTDPAHCKLARLEKLVLFMCLVTAAYMPALARLPRLQVLMFGMRFWPDALPHLASLRSLTSLDLHMQGARPVNLASATPALPHLSACALLTGISFMYFSFTQADVQTLVAMLPQMKECNFHESQVQSLAPLSRSHHLRRLFIRPCNNLRAADLQPLAGVKSLRVIYVRLPLNEHAAARALLSGPNFHLEFFDIEPPPPRE